MFRYPIGTPVATVQVGRGVGSGELVIVGTLRAVTAGLVGRAVDVAVGYNPE